MAQRVRLARYCACNPVELSRWNVPVAGKPCASLASSRSPRVNIVNFPGMKAIRELRIGAGTHDPAH